MTSAASKPIMTAHGPEDLICAVPYLLGFHPAESLVLVGLEARTVAVTVRVDLAMAMEEPQTLRNSLLSMRRGGATRFVILVFDEHAAPGRDDVRLPWSDLVADVADDVEGLGGEPVDGLLVSNGRYWSYRCFGLGCCPDVGTVVTETSSEIPARATYAGLVALPDREAMSTLLAPDADSARAELQPAIDEARSRAAHQLAEGGRARLDRKDVRALFAAQRRLHAVGEERPAPCDLDEQSVARFAVALRRIDVRDAVWMAVDDGRLPGDELWRHLGKVLPAPYDAAPMFLVGWSAWRRGNGASAHAAAERALRSDPTYTAADLLVAVLSGAVNPRTFPKLRRSVRRDGPTRGGRG